MPAKIFPCSHLGASWQNLPLFLPKHLPPKPAHRVPSALLTITSHCHCGRPSMFPQNPLSISTLSTSHQNLCPPVSPQQFLLQLSSVLLLAFSTNTCCCLPPQCFLPKPVSALLTKTFPSFCQHFPPILLALHPSSMILTKLVLLSPVSCYLVTSYSIYSPCGYGMSGLMLYLKA